MKTCTKCNTSKDESEFRTRISKERKFPFTYSQCKVCEKLYRDSRKEHLKKWRSNNKWRKREFDIKNREKRNTQRKENPIIRKQYLAQLTLSNAIRAGKTIKRNCCEFCYSTENIHGHHEDYSKPLDVIWICKDCHSLLHSHYVRDGIKIT